MTDDNNTYVAKSTRCYEWTCKCGRVNLTKLIRAGFSNQCVWCHVLAKIRAIEFEDSTMALGFDDPMTGDDA